MRFECFLAEHMLTQNKITHQFYSIVRSKMKVFKVDLLEIIILLFSFSFPITVYTSVEKPCIPRKFNYSSIVCVCNATYCDEIPEIKYLENGKYSLYSSSMSGERFKRRTGFLEKLPPNYESNHGDLIWHKGDIFTGKVYIKIHRNETYQSIHGFGATFSDATGINMNHLSSQTLDNLINSYFSKNGLEYNIGRVPIASTDFSEHSYAYNMYPENDEKLSNFSLSREDFEYKIPIIQKALKVNTSELFLMGSAWSPPLWMKTVQEYTGTGELLPDYYQTWADYHIRFLEEYAKHNISFWSLTTGNEPINGILPLVKLPGLRWFPVEQAKWIADNLGPTLKSSEFSHVLIITIDDQRIALPWWMKTMAKNKKAMEYIDGIALHWYTNKLTDTEVVDKTHELFPKQFIIGNEACIEQHTFISPEIVQLGSWERSEAYMKDIVDDLKHWHTGWIDWNLALDRSGGPNCFNNKADATVIVMPDSDEFYKQPLFYVMGHFSKFIPRGSKRILTEDVSGLIEHVAFLRPDGMVVLLFYNVYDIHKTITVMEERRGIMRFTIPPHSIHSLVYG